MIKTTKLKNRKQQQSILTSAHFIESRLLISPKLLQELKSHVSFDQFKPHLTNLSEVLGVSSSEPLLEYIAVMDLCPPSVTMPILNFLGLEPNDFSLALDWMHDPTKPHFTAEQLEAITTIDYYLRLNQSKKIALIGELGVGKSTIIDYLHRVRHQLVDDMVPGDFGVVVIQEFTRASWIEANARDPHAYKSHQIVYLNSPSLISDLVYIMINIFESNFRSAPNYFNITLYDLKVIAKKSLKAPGPINSALIALKALSQVDPSTKSKKIRIK